MVIRKCDRCGKQIENTENYFTITIREGKSTTRTLCKNTQKEYCKDCIEEIRKVVNNVR